MRHFYKLLLKVIFMQGKTWVFFNIFFL